MNQLRSASALTALPFRSPDLDRIAKIAAAVRNQQENNNVARSDTDRLYVDHEGGIILGDELGSRDPSRMSEVTTETFFLGAQ